MKVSIVIPAFNEEKMLPATLRSIAAAAEAFHARGWQTEVIVCDNNSTDATAEIARREGARVVFEPLNQIARARNTGASIATGDWLIFIDADSQPSRELFNDVAEAMIDDRFVGGGATVIMDENFAEMHFVARLWNWISRTQKWCAGSFIFCRAEAFRAIGGFSAELYASEEIDFSKRLKRYGKARGQRLTILHRHPLITSARKIRLYRRREYFLLLWRNLITQGRALKQREACHVWYDGRR